MSRAKSPLQALADVANFGQRSLVAHIRSALTGSGSVLDVGCGYGTILTSLGLHFEYTLGLDAHEPAVEASRAQGLHDEYIVGEVGDLALPDNSFDAVIMMDVIEHLEPVAARETLAQLERIAHKVVVIFTPNGWVDQDEKLGNAYQVHRSGWSADDFRALGFDVIGAKGWRRMRGEESVPRWPQALSRAVLALSQPIVERCPELAYSLLAVKRLDRARAAVSARAGESTGSG